MSYIVLARKYRPQMFDEVIAQEHITEQLKGAVESGRLANGYLFCGPRGVGKTSCARILAKSLNCEKGPTNKPCGKCSACVEIAKGSSFDVLEIDGASNRGIDEIRALRENVKFAPSMGKYKIYIVDEVHMLTNEAFNALLKTLEEPPEHVIFIFATTAPNKVPATIVSRCQRYDFKRIPTKIIAKVLSDVCKEEKLKASEEALFAIAKAAKGGLRDALSVLDQLSVSASKKIGEGDVSNMLGLVESEHIFELVDSIADKDCGSALKVFNEILDKGKDVKQLAKDIIEHLRNLMIIKVGAHSLGKLVDCPNSEKDMLLEQSKKFELRNIIIAIEIFIKAQESARITETMNLPLEVAIAKLTYKGEDSSPAYTQQQKEEPKQAKTAKPSFSPAKPLSNKNGQIDITGREEVEDPQGEQEELTLDRIRSMWDSLTHAVSRHKMSVATYLQEGIPVSFEESRLTIAFETKCKFHKQALENSDNIKLVESVFKEKLGSLVIIKYIIDDSIEAKMEDPKVKNILDTFGGEVIHKWHNE